MKLAVHQQESRTEGRAFAAYGHKPDSPFSPNSSTTTQVSPFQAITVEDVAEAWLKVIVKKALPLDLVNDRLFREAVALTAKCGSKNLLVGNEIRLPYRKHFTEKLLPKLDEKLDSNIRRKVQGLRREAFNRHHPHSWESVQSPSAYTWERVQSPSPAPVNEWGGGQLLEWA